MPRMRKRTLMKMIAATGASVGASRSGGGRPKKPANHDPDGNGVMKFYDDGKPKRMLPAENAEQLVPPGAPLTKEALAVARKQYSAMKKKGKK